VLDLKVAPTNLSSLTFFWWKLDLPGFLELTFDFAPLGTLAEEQLIVPNIPKRQYPNSRRALIN